SRPRGKAALLNKHVAVVGASTGAFGAVWAQAELRKVLGTAGARVVEGEVSLGHADQHFDGKGSLAEEDLRDERREVVEAVVEAARDLPEAPGEARPQRRVVAVRVEVPAGAAAGGPHSALHALLDRRVVVLLHLAPDLHGGKALALHGAQRVEHVLELRLDHV